MWQVRHDAAVSNPGDAQGTFDLLSSQEKEMIWIDGTTQRFKDGYNWFGRHPDKVLAFLDKHMR